MTFDLGRGRCTTPVVTSFKEYVARFTEELRRNPALPPPDARPRTVEELHDWKQQSRAFDQARLDLGLVTPEQLQRENSAFSVDRKTVRIVRFAQHDTKHP